MTKLLLWDSKNVAIALFFLGIIIATTLPILPIFIISFVFLLLATGIWQGKYYTAGIIVFTLTAAGILFLAYYASLIFALPAFFYLAPVALLITIFAIPSLVHLLLRAHRIDKKRLVLIFQLSLFLTIGSASAFLYIQRYVISPIVFQKHIQETRTQRLSDMTHGIIQQQGDKNLFICKPEKCGFQFSFPHSWFFREPGYQRYKGLREGSENNFILQVGTPDPNPVALTSEFGLPTTSSVYNLYLVELSEEFQGRELSAELLREIGGAAPYCAGFSTALLANKQVFLCPNGLVAAGQDIQANTNQKWDSLSTAATIAFRDEVSGNNYVLTFSIPRSHDPAIPYALSSSEYAEALNEILKSWKW